MPSEGNEKIDLVPGSDSKSRDLAAVSDSVPAFAVLVEEETEVNSIAVPAVIVASCQVNDLVSDYESTDDSESDSEPFTSTGFEVAERTVNSIASCKGNEIQ